MLLLCATNEVYNICGKCPPRRANLWASRWAKSAFAIPDRQAISEGFATEDTEVYRGRKGKGIPDPDTSPLPSGPDSVFSVFDPVLSSPLTRSARSPAAS